MFNNEIMKQGEKIKRIRKMLHMTQEELAEGICSKQNISLIENNKQKISVNLANAIAKKFNRIAKEKEINISTITPGELMIDEDEQANYIFSNNIISELKEIQTIDLFEQKLLKAENIIREHVITDSNKIELYKLATDFYYYRYQYTKSDKMCDNGLKICINSLNNFEEAIFYIYHSRNYIFTENYIKALQQLDYAEKLNSHIMDDNLSIMILYHRGLTYKKLGEYDTALKYFKILKEKNVKDKTMLLKIKMMYANCLTEKNEFEEAEKEYFEILSINDKDFIALAYKNLSELYLNNKKYKESAKCIKESLIYNEKNVYLDESLFFAAKVLTHVNEDVETYLLQALEICEGKDRENLDLIKDIIDELVLIYIEREEEENLMLMADKAKVLNINYCLSYARISKYYKGRNEEKSTYFTNELIDKLKQV
ncbi:DNA-binding XRE family transcriptional regulator [Clostridium saccharoperbutylacetonicum]|uniref:Putative transcriptional regulator n=1 Tax=Clostridium saccharoperbutylacetonicum N1-4(HMT) TaxID=931276 RepID=M1MY12_9CLOT|nr:helix-turn-helix transcriptional regulator [Clostridium saccharoperbutylacetonicum]AGF59421.1 putative transcriptional regulator [Clostridium saccharoperbutylacetonicum N1-4(HMT)]NRT59787.1 DNA-binding XRE family transcriptional regulator [Clostridium saccharoperbutylacetonicum]NSB23099.1 DNA-binding XRE family transcriptional regulator [Clostridium saccharoperbutylacetonicum]NSB42470.1 DNA-binding XRE family transcriptional regulator [Clostridium saccharoperbutylacetonicum]